MKKLANARLPVIVAFALALGVLLGYVFKNYNIDFVWIFAVIPPFTVIFITVAVFKRSVKPLVFIALILIFGIGGALNCFFRIDNYEKSETWANTGYEITGTVAEKGKTDYGEYVILTNAYADSEKLSGKIRVYLGENYGEFCDVGYTIKFYAELSHYDSFSYGKLNYNAENNVKYSCTVNKGVISYYRFSLLGAIRGRLRNVLFDNLDKDTAAVCYAMLTGNTDYVDNDTMDSFRFGGIAHIFAVSGLHIGIVFAIVSFICRKLRVNKFIAAAICLCFITFYAGICGFTLSSVRAVIMCAVSTVSKLIYAKNDSLNALSIAVIVILSITPLSLFAVGFQLSVCAVIGICLLAQKIKHRLRKIKIPEKIASAVGVSLGAQAGTFPVMMTSFGYISGAGLLLNIIVVPILSTLFVILFLCTFISAAIPAAASFLITVAGLPLQAVLSFLIGAGFEKAIISGVNTVLFAPLYFIGLFLISDKLNLKKIVRAVMVFCTCLALGIFILFENFLPINGYKIIVSAYYGGGEVMIKSEQGNVLVVTENLSPDKLSITLNKYSSSKLNGVIILGGEKCVDAYGKLNVNCKDVYVFYLYFPIQPYSGVTVHYESEFTLCGIDFAFEDGYSLSADCNGVNLGICGGQIPFRSCDLLISARFLLAF